MSFATDRFFSLAFNARPPLDCLPARMLNAIFPRPAPGLWSDWLATWGWTWSVNSEACLPADPMLALWSGQDNWPASFDTRALSLAVALQMKIDGVPLCNARSGSTPSLQRTWHQITSLDEDSLGQMLALALLRETQDIFDFASVCPNWPADVSLVIAERQPLARQRAPDPVWLELGYRMLGSAFEQLRGLGASFDDCLAVYEDFANSQQVPAAFDMAFWWEAAYCLTERHAYPDAERAQALVAELASALEARSGLVDPLWHHQQGRLHYYAGNHADALAEYLRELRVHGDDLNVQAMLEREIANVLSDLACLDAASRFAESSITHARAQGQRSELYKSLGRLGEIRVKQGDFTTAENLHAESLSIQGKLGGNRAPAQTLTYLGHLALMRGILDQAADRYADAARHDVDGSSAPYLTMGRFALAARQGNAVELDQLWSAHRAQIMDWCKHLTHVLPAAACTLAAATTLEPARDALPAMARALLDSRYAIEALPLLAKLPEGKRKPLLQDAMALLNRWQKALTALPPSPQGNLRPAEWPILPCRKTPKTRSGHRCRLGLTELSPEPYRGPAVIDLPRSLFINNLAHLHGMFTPMQSIELSQETFSKA